MLKLNWFAAPVALLAALFLLAGCGGRPKPREAAQAERDAEVPADAVVGAQTEPDAEVQPDAGIQPGTLGGGAAESSEMPLRRNDACLAMFELTGPVKSCQEECWQIGTAEGDYERPDMMWSREYGFNRRGYLEIDGCTEYTYRADTVFLYGEDAQAGMSASLTYDAAGRIVAQKLEYEGDAVGDGERSVEYAYDDAGRLIRSFTVFGETALETTYEYDAAGRLATRRERAQDYDGETERIHICEYVRFDERGNWTQRRVVVESSATQPVEGEEHERSEVVRDPDAYQFESRIITYYE